MTVALALLSGAATVGWLAPASLWRLHTTRIDPLGLIVAWLAAIIGMLGTAAAGVVLLLVPSHGVDPGLVGLLSSCWSAFVHGTSRTVEQIAGALGVAMVAALLLRLVVIGARHIRQAASDRRERLAVLRLAARTEHTAPPTLWLAHDRPLAFSLAGRPGYVVATEGLARHLTYEQLRAVLEHERAHLRGRHHLLVALAEVTAAALPFVPLLRQSPAALRELVELCADLSAVGSCGASALRSALVRVTDGPTPGAALGIGQDAVALRLRRLERVIDSVKRRRVWMSVLPVAVVLTPTVVAALLLVGVSRLFCPLF